MAKNRQTGQRLKLDDNMISRICGQIKKAVPIKTAVLSCGIGLSTYYEWKTIGEAHREKKKKSKYTDFLDELEHANAVAQQRLIGRVIEMGGWKGSLEILKRRWPNDFGDKQTLTGPDGMPLATAGAGAFMVNFQFNAPPDDNPFTYDESAMPPSEEKQPDSPE